MDVSANRAALIRLIVTNVYAIAAALVGWQTGRLGIPWWPLFVGLFCGALFGYFVIGPFMTRHARG